MTSRVRRILALAALGVGLYAAAVVTGVLVEDEQSPKDIGTVNDRGGKVELLPTMIPKLRMR